MIWLKCAWRKKNYTLVKKTKRQKYFKKIKTHKCKTILKKLRVLWQRRRKSRENQLKHHLLLVHTFFDKSTLSLPISYGLHKNFMDYPWRGSSRLLIIRNNNLLFFRSIRLATASSMTNSGWPKSSSVSLGTSLTSGAGRQGGVWHNFQSSIRGTNPKRKFLSETSYPKFSSLEILEFIQLL